MKALIILLIILSSSPLLAQTQLNSYGNQTYGTVNGQQYNAQRYGNQTNGNISNKSFNT